MIDPIVEIKSRLSIEDVVAPYVQLKKAGKYFKACCPFHQEKTPSFYVNPEKQMAYCFGCHKGGDIFQFIQEIEGLEFKEALEFLAEKAHVELPEKPTAPRVNKDEKERLRAVHADANIFFVQNLWASGDAEKVLAYVKARGLEEATIREFKIGFAPSSTDTLYRFLLEKGHDKADLLGTSLVVARDSGAKDVHDRFKLRLMLPIQDVSGDVVAFGGRALKKGDEPKYLNSSEYALYHKGEMLYNFHRAKPEIKAKDEVLFVEGYFDVMASWQAGVKHVVATSGTALTEMQLRLVKRFTRRIVFAFDGDAAGQAALLRSVKLAQPLGLDLFVVTIPEGKDAADTVKTSPQKWVDAVAQKMAVLDFYFSAWDRAFDLSTAAGKKSYTDLALDLLQGVSHPVERDHYLKQLSQKVGTPVELLYDYLGQLKVPGLKKVQRTATLPTNTLKRAERLVVYFIGLLLSYPADFFALYREEPSLEAYRARLESLGLVNRLHTMNPEHFSRFWRELPNLLEPLSQTIPVSSVYKQIEAHYNSAGTVDEHFYAQLPSEMDAQLLQRFAFEAEVKTMDTSLVREEFEKLLALLYFETLTL